MNGDAGSPDKNGAQKIARLWIEALECKDESQYDQNAKEMLLVARALVTPSAVAPAYETCRSCGTPEECRNTQKCFWDGMGRVPANPSSEGTGDRQLLRDLSTALNDWLHQYAPEMCDAEKVKESVCRVWGDAGGTLAYIADLQKRIKEARSIMPSETSRLSELVQQLKREQADIRTSMEAFYDLAEKLENDLAENVANEQAYERILGKRSYQEVADELAERTSERDDAVAEGVRLENQLEAALRSATGMLTREEAALVCEMNGDSSIGPEWNRACRSCAHQLRAGLWKPDPMDSTTTKEKS